MSGEWAQSSLRALCKGPGAYGSGAPAKEWDPNQARYVRITDIQHDGRLDPSSRASLPLAVARPYILEEGDVLFARSGATVGKTYLYDVNDGLCAHAGYVIKFRPEPTAGLPRFVFWWTQSQQYWRWVNRTLRQGAQPNINAKEYGEQVLPLPPLPEQRRIAEILDTLDEAIRKTEQVIAKLQQMKQGLLHDLLTRGIDENGELRDPLRHPEQFKDSPLGRIPKEWEVGALGDAADLQVGFAFKSDWFRDTGEVRLLRGDNVGFGELEWKTPKFLDSARVSQFNEYLLRSGDVVIGMDRTFTKAGAKVSQLCHADVPSLLVQRVGKFSPRKATAAYIRALLSWRRLLEELQSLQKGMDIPHLSKQEILSPGVPIPARCEQDRISDHLERHTDRLRSELGSLSKLRLLKQGLMDDLLTGRVRVNVTEAAE